MVREGGSDLNLVHDEWVIIGMVLYIQVILCMLDNVESCMGILRHIVMCWGILWYFLHFFLYTYMYRYF